MIKLIYYYKNKNNSTDQLPPFEFAFVSKYVPPFHEYQTP